MHQNFNKEKYRKRTIIEGKYSDNFFVDETSIKNLLTKIGNFTNIEIVNGPIVASKIIEDEKKWFVGALTLEESVVMVNIWTKNNFFSLDIFLTKKIDTEEILKFISQESQLISFSYFEVPDPIVFEEDQKIEIRKLKDKGAAIFAKKFIPAETVLSYVDGPIFFAKKESQVPFFVRDHAVPFSPFFYRNAFNSSAVKFNHSCNPNTYFKNLFFVTTMRNIEPGEELTYSYSLICNSDWVNPEGKCLCGSEKCLGQILPWRKLPKEYKLKYLPYTSDWILFEEMKNKNLLINLEETIKKEM